MGENYVILKTKIHEYIRTMPIENNNINPTDSEEVHQ